MIKNFLYSLFLHLSLLLIVYANFNLKNVEEAKTSEIAVSLVALNGDENPNSLKASESGSKAEEKISKKNKAVAKEAKSQKKSSRNKVKHKSKKNIKSKPEQSVSNTKENQKIQEFKPQEKPQEKQEEQTKQKDEKPDETEDENQKEVQDNDSDKEIDLGSKQKSNKEEEATDQKDVGESQPSNTANNLENIDLSAREKFNIQSQLRRCYKRAVDENNFKTEFNVAVKVTISEDGYIDSDLEDSIDKARYNNPKEPGYKIAVDNVRRAIDLCSPLRNLPLDKYDVWKEVILNFDEEDKGK